MLAKLKKIGLVLVVFLGVIITIVVAGLILTRGNYKVPATATTDKRISTIDLNGGTFHYETYGNDNNPTIIVIHGGPGADYRSLLSLSQLKDQYYIVFYDQRGTGLSPRIENPEILTYNKSLEDLDAFVNQFSSNKKVILIGHSFGGVMASTYAASNPDKVDRLILAEPGPLNDQMNKIGPKLTNNNMMVYLKALFESFHIKNPPDKKAHYDYVTGQLMIDANPDYWCGDIPHESVKGWRFSYDTYQNVIKSFFNKDGSQINAIESIGNFNGETLFMVGECNKVIGEDFQLKQMAYFKSAKMVVVKNAGHGLFAENPEDSIKAVKEFLN